MTKEFRPRPKRNTPAPASVDTDFLAIQALTFLGSDPDRADRFFATSGLTPGDLRRAAADPDFLNGLLDYLVADEALLLAFAQAAALSPEAVVLAHARLSARHPDEA